MPIYFAYGANMDVAAMAQRCPSSRPLGPARLMNYRFFIMTDGFASVRRAAGSAVYGLLWDLALADVAALDRFEDVASGRYGKIVQPVIRSGAGGVQALIYVGASQETGLPRPGYLESVIAAARCGRPAPKLPAESRCRAPQWHTRSRFRQRGARPAGTGARREAPVRHALRPRLIALQASTAVIVGPKTSSKARRRARSTSVMVTG